MSVVEVRYAPHGQARDLFERRDPELVIAGPAGTGKTRAALEKVHLAAGKYAGMRGLLLRKTHVSLTGTALVTYREQVVHALDGVAYYGGSAAEPPQYRYPNGARLMLGGLDNPTKIMSGDYDLIYVNEATELTEPEWEIVTTRARHGVMPYQQVIADCNPGPPSHWLRQRAQRGDLTMLESRHQDNPRLWDGAAWTAAGAAYIARLDRLTGVRKSRLRHGIWAAAEGMVYDGWDPAIHLIDHFDVPAAWPRFWVIDFGFVNPFVWQQWAMDGDGRLYREREIYMTRRIVADHAAAIRAVTADDPPPRAIICDHDAEDRATLERTLGLPPNSTTAARKAISPGIQAVQERLRPQEDGRPRLLFLRDALVEWDETLQEALRPICSDQEVESYVWDTSLGRRRGEVPVDRDNHGLDCIRYLVAYHDLAEPAARQHVALPMIAGMSRRPAPRR